MFLVKLHAFTITGSNRVWDGVFLEKLEAFLINMKTLLMAVTKFVLQSAFGKLQASTLEMSVNESVTEFVFSKVFGFY